MKNEILKDFGKTIRFLRNQMEFTQEELAEKTGFHRTYIGQIERGERNPSLKNIEIFAKAFNYELYELFKELRDINN
jgi:transcriptional regulator with XRE-family HTH domain